jgi:hypothetical protein
MDYYFGNIVLTEKAVKGVRNVRKGPVAIGKRSHAKGVTGMALFVRMTTPRERRPLWIAWQTDVLCVKRSSR